jgi:tRNA A37 threonylcarbamoyladenosine biosynthesis protein TsaE
VTDPLEDENVLTLVEWAAYLPESSRPKVRLDIRFGMWHSSRTLRIVPHGAAAQTLLQGVLEEWNRLHGRRPQD